MRPVRTTDAHKTDGLAELVCSNSFRSDDAEASAVGLLHEEMRRAGSLIMASGDAHKLPAGGALAVDRHHFSAAVTRRLAEHPLITIARGEVLRMGSATAHLQGALRLPDGTRLATATATAALRPFPHPA